MPQSLAIHELQSDTSVSNSTWSSLQKQNAADISPPWYSLSYHISSFPKITGINTKLVFYRKKFHAYRVQFLLLGIQEQLHALAVHLINMAVSKGICTCWKTHQSTAKHCWLGQTQFQARIQRSIQNLAKVILVYKGFKCTYYQVFLQILCRLSSCVLTDKSEEEQNSEHCPEIVTTD